MATATQAAGAKKTRTKPTPDQVKEQLAAARQRVKELGKR